MKSVQEFYEEVLKSKDLQKEFVGCKKEEDLTSFLKKHDCGASIEDVQKFFQSKFNEEGKVQDAELEKLAGGCPKRDISTGQAVVEGILSALTLGATCVPVVIASAARAKANSSLCHQ